MNDSDGTVFVSSRMLQVRERRALVHAVTSCHLLPLAFERAPHSPAAKSVMDAMLERSSFFVLPYNGDIGNPSSILHGYTPLEYEFWHFFVTLYFNATRGEAGETRRPIYDYLLARPDAMRHVFNRAIGGARDDHARKARRELCRRVRVLCSQTRYDELKRRGPVHLASLPSECFLIVEGADQALLGDEFHLYEAASRAARSFAASSIHNPTRNRQEYRLEFALEDKALVLEVVLRALLLSGFDLHSLHTPGHLSQEGESLRQPSSIHGVPIVNFRIRGEFTFADPDVETAREELARYLGMCLSDVSITFTTEDLLVASDDRQEDSSDRIVVSTEKLETTDIVAEVTFIDIPGALWDIVSMLERSDPEPNIVYCVDSDAGQAQPRQYFQHFKKSIEKRLPGSKINKVLPERLRWPSTRTVELGLSVASSSRSGREHSARSIEYCLQSVFVVQGSRACPINFGKAKA